jgi:hypothetical protein
MITPLLLDGGEDDDAAAVMPDGIMGEVSTEAAREAQAAAKFASSAAKGIYFISFRDLLAFLY